MSVSISKQISMMELSQTVMGRNQCVYPTLLHDGEELILVDTGYPGQLPLIEQEMVSLGYSVNNISRIILTHQDLDHIGNLPGLREASPHAEIISDPIEQPYIQGDKLLIRITPESIVKSLASLPAEVPDQMKQAFKLTLENPPKAPVDRTVVNKETLPYGGGITVVETPGHTPGHISLYHEASKTLIAGDALVVANGELLGPSPIHTLDMKKAIDSLKQLDHYDINCVICYHGGIYKGEANQRITEIINQFEQ
ncbi:MBL fold metallo-hydrolase [Paenibacillus sp. Marseille-Q4541]|uniref:MBL fold metallo-hydrolase n=1 Tax=Paenibacillus sp. Marseille-Q4541 TaxID=2831522 RepID=UPI002018FD65|nr:MBL fold metallo-hydrolase [Paenibacillus sp. Marseille-Q4541]